MFQAFAGRDDSSDCDLKLLDYLLWAFDNNCAPYSERSVSFPCFKCFTLLRCLCRLQSESISHLHDLDRIIVRKMFLDLFFCWFAVFSLEEKRNHGNALFLLC